MSKTRTEHVAFDKAAAASHVVVAPPDGSRRIRVKAVHLVSAGTVNLTFEDSDGTNLTGLMALAAQSMISLPLHPLDDFYFECPLGKGLNILLSGAVQVGGFIIYQIDQEVVP